MNKQVRYSPEFRELAVRMLLDQQGEYESQGAAMNSIAAKVEYFGTYIPLPAAAWLFGSALLGLGYIKRKNV